MNSFWSLFSRADVRRGEDTGTPPLADVAEASREAVVAPRDRLGDIGQDAEDVRERVERLMGRLDEVKTLAHDFDQIMLPVRGFVDRYTAAEAKLVEVTASLTRESDAARALRSDLIRVQEESAKAEDQLGAALPRIQALQASVRDLEAELAQRGLELNQRSALATDLERRLEGEIERASGLHSENQAARLELDHLDASRSRLEGDAVQLRDQLGRLESENAHLRTSFDGLAQKHAEAKNRLSEVEPQCDSFRVDLVALESKLLLELAARQKAEQALDAARASFDADIASLQLKLDGLEAQAETTDKLLTHAREQSRERANALRLAERSFNRLAAEKAAIERRAETDQAAANRSAANAQDSQRAYAELQNRCDVMSKALAAKDLAVDDANVKQRATAARLEELMTRLDQERSHAETATRRLMEELQSEKAERSLTQGALDIARGSRLKLLNQNSELKRKQTGAGTSAKSAAQASDRPVQPGEYSNVHQLKVGDRDTERASADEIG